MISATDRPALPTILVVEDNAEMAAYVIVVPHLHEERAGLSLDQPIASA